MTTDAPTMPDLLSVYDESKILTYETVYQLYYQNPLPIRLIDLTYNVQAQNPAMDRLTGITNPDVHGHKCFEITTAAGNCHTENCPINMMIALRQSKLPKQIPAYYDCVLPNKKTFPARSISVPFWDSHGKIAGVIQAIFDETDHVAIANALEDKNSELERSLNLIKGYHDITKLLATENHLEELAQKTLSLLSMKLNVVTSALYVLNEQNLLKPIATFCLKTKPKEFAIGEGFPGQVALEKKPIFLNELPSDYLAFTSAPGELKPVNIACFPIMTKDALIGVIELGSFRDMQPIKEFMDGLLDQLSIAIQNSMNFERISRLVTEMQDQNEQLLAQNEELQAQGEELLAQSEEIQAQTEELSSQRDALEKKSIEAEQANRMKSVFLSNMSHELRTPLNSILGLARLMLQDNRTPLTEKHQEYLDIMLRNGENLLDLINDILDLTRIEAGREDMKFSKFEVMHFLNTLVSNIEPMAVKKQLDFRIETYNAPEQIFTDQRKLRQVLTNLLANAVKFTEKGEVILRCFGKYDSAKDYIFFEVEDTGIGVPDGYEEAIFEPFRQVDDSYSRRYEGTGLGLSICKKLVELLGGKITYRKAQPKGSIFSVEIPVDRRGKDRLPDEQWKQRLKSTLLTTRKQQTHPQYEENTQEQAVSSLAMSKPVEKVSLQKEGKQHDATTDVPISDTRHKIVIIDDDMLSVRQLILTLKDQKFVTSYAFDGQNGLKLIRETQPDLILLDLKMPVMDGFAVMRQMQKDPLISHIPVLLLSAMDIDTNILKSLPTNMKGVLQKGNIKREDLLNYIETIINTKNLKQQTSTDTFNSIKTKNCLATCADEGYKKKIVLIVEDNPDNLFLCKEILGMENYTILTARNGADALDAVGCKEIDLVLMDIQMPGMNGIDAIKELVETGKKNMPVIALTAKAMKGDREQLLQAGFDDYLAKPIIPDELIMIVNLWLTKQR